LNQHIIELEHTIAQYEAMLTPAEEEPTPSYEEYASKFDAATPEQEPEVSSDVSTWDSNTWIAYIKAGVFEEVRKNKLWTEGEDHIILMSVGKGADAFKISNMAKGLGRTIQAINSRAIVTHGLSVYKDRIVYPSKNKGE
jgi:hypothetical protein